MRSCALVLAVALALAATRGTDARQEKSDGPTALAAAFGALWVGTGRGELLEIDLATGQIRKRVRKEPGQIGHVAAVVAAHRAVWLSDSGLGVARVNPRRARPPRIVFPSHGSLAADRRSLWAANPWREQVLRIDPARARVVASVRVPGRLVNVFAGPAGAYVVYAPTSGPLTGPEGVRLLQRLDPITAQLVGEPAPFDCDLTAVVGRNAVWTIDFCTWRVARRNPRMLAVEVAQVSPPTATFATLGFNSVWVSGGSRLVRFDATTLRVQARLWVRGSVTAAGEGGIWILDGVLLRMLDPRTNRIVRTFRVPARSHGLLALSSRPRDDFGAAPSRAASRVSEVDTATILERLNPEQRRAAEAVRGPVCILAGAGSGKTTTITHRIANQVASGAFVPEQLLAVTFTEKAAGEMRARLARLGVQGARASTFHSAALAQLSFFGRVRDLQVLASKALPLRWIGNGLPMPYKFKPAADLATEVEWAKNRRLTPETYLDGLDGHEPPMPPELMQRVFRDYERRKEARGYVDFEDLLEDAIRLYDDDATALEIVRTRYRAITVDEYQDVNLLQQTLLDRWLGERDELCAVGDDYQAIYAFTGATPEYLLGLPERFPHATVVRLEENYRSTPEVLELANRLVPRLEGAAKTLRSTRAAGAEPVVRCFAGADDETDFVVERVHSLHDTGVPCEEMAVLHRTNARSAAFEEAFTLAEIPFQGAALLERDAARQLRKALVRDGYAQAAVAVRETAVAHGLLAHLPPRIGEREVTRQNDLRLLVTIAGRLGPDATVDDYLEHLRSHFGGGSGSGVHLLTYHRAKGLEFDAVFLPRLQDRELPSKFARTSGERAEERRLLYVGMTRAREHLTITWSGKASPFLRELGVDETPAVAEDDPLLVSLKRWRLERAKEEGKPAYVVFHDTTLAAIAATRPASEAELRAVPGIGPAKLERYGADVLAAVAAGVEAPAA